MGVKRQLNPKLEIGGILMTMVDNRTTLSRGVIDQIRRPMGDGYSTVKFPVPSELPKSVWRTKIFLSMTKRGAQPMPMNLLRRR